MLRLVGIVLVLSAFLVCFSGSSGGYAASTSPSNNRQIELEAEYLYPINDQRQIDTTSYHLLFGRTNPRRPHSVIYTGLTMTRAWGSIQDACHRGCIENSAHGVGPMLLERYEMGTWDQFSLSIDLSGALIFYDADFPANGSFYDFMWRIGPRFVYHSNDRCAVNFGYTWMHVSNGQSKRNPSYNGRGPTLGITLTF